MIWRTSGIVALQQELVFQLGGITGGKPIPGLETLMDLNALTVDIS